MLQDYHALKGSHRFNTQPPEGGWTLLVQPQAYGEGFNTQPPEGGWASCFVPAKYPTSFNTQPPEGGWGRYREDSG